MVQLFSHVVQLFSHVVQLVSHVVQLVSHVVQLVSHVIQLVSHVVPLLSHVVPLFGVYGHVSLIKLESLAPEILPGLRDLLLQLRHRLLAIVEGGHPADKRRVHNI